MIEHQWFINFSWIRRLLVELDVFIPQLYMGICEHDHNKYIFLTVNDISY